MLRFAAVAAWWLLCSSAFADDAAALRLGTLLGSMRELEADFSQHLFDEKGELLQQSSGHVLLAHPGRFRWETREPFEQLVVSDGTTVWQYDPDLAQVVVRPLDRRADQVPSLLLSGDIQSVEAQFDIGALPPHGNSERFEMHPHESGGMFVQLDIAFVDGVLQEFAIIDGLGQRTTVQFFGVATPGTIPPGTFDFVTPAGVDELHDD